MAKGIRQEDFNSGITYLLSKIKSLLVWEQNSIQETGAAQIVTLKPNKLYTIGDVTPIVSNITINLSSGITGMVNEYHFTLTTGETIPTVTWPSGLSWNGGIVPTITGRKTYEISILNNIATSMEV